MKLLILFLMLGLSCSNKDNKESISKNLNDTLSNQNNYSENKKEISDTLFFEKKKDISSNIHILDDEGKLKIDSLNLLINLIEGKNEKYDLIIEKKGVKIFSKGYIEGISKIYISDKYLAFSIYSVFSEDGNNNGYSIIYDLSKNKFLESTKMLNNTCNPIVLNDKIYLIEDLSLLIADFNFNVLERKNIHYKSKNNSLNYLDTFLICDLDGFGNKISLNFTSSKSNTPCETFVGFLKSEFNNIVLTE